MCQSWLIWEGLTLVLLLFYCQKICHILTKRFYYKILLFLEMSNGFKIRGNIKYMEEVPIQMSASHESMYFPIKRQCCAWPDLYNAGTKFVLVDVVKSTFHFRKLIQNPLIVEEKFDYFNEGVLFGVILKAISWLHQAWLWNASDWASKSVLSRSYRLFVLTGL